MNGEAARDALMREQARLIDLLTTSDQPAEGSELSHVDQHTADSATETFEQEAVSSLRASVVGELADVRRAVTRLELGTYGKCQRCGATIPDERLVAVPAAAYCTTHEDEAEGFGSALTASRGTRLAGMDDVDRHALAGLSVLPDDGSGDADEGDPAIEEAAMHLMGAHTEGDARAATIEIEQALADDGASPTTDG